MLQVCRGLSRAAPTLPAGRRAVLYALRRRGEASAEQIAEQLDMTVSGARQHLAERQIPEYLYVRRKMLRHLVRVIGHQHGAQAQFPRSLDRLLEESLHRRSRRSGREDDGRLTRIQKLVSIGQERSFAVRIP